MSVNAEVQKSGNETALATIRKFSRKVQGAGLVKTIRNRRYFSRDVSKIVKKKRALKLLKRRAQFKQMVKEGKIAEAPIRLPSRASMRPSTAEGSAPSRFGEGTPIAR